jgi:DNA-binding NtrC family response regulator
MADIVLVDDDAELVQSLVRVLSRLVAPRTLSAAGSAKKALEMCAAERPSVAIIDLCLDEQRGTESGFDVLRSLKAAHSEMRVIVVTGHGSTTNGVQAMQLGAASFLEKPVDPEHLAALIRDAIAQAELRRAYQELARERRVSIADGLVGVGRAIERVREEIDFVASTQQPVLLLGETGTGKGVCARLIHQLSARRSRKFVHYNPSFAGGDIVQSELFGHVKGAFTGAAETRRGLVLEADRGTLFIDELDAIPSDTQVMLLDVLQEQRVRSVGADTYQLVDCRFIAATNRPLDDALSAGLIRRDLHHRLAHCIIELPPLRERREDLPALAEYVLERLRERDGVNVFGCTADALARCAAYAWPGNVREFQGVLENAAYRANFRGRSEVALEDLPFDRLGGTQVRDVPGGSFHEQVEAFKRALVRQALESCAGNQVQAATLLGVDRGTVRRLGAH